MGDFSNAPYKLWGADGSPYSCKIRAVLRYKRLSYVWIPTFSKGAFDGSMWDEFPKLRAKVIPVLVNADGTYANDSTPLIKQLDASHPHRSVQSQNGAVNFLADVLEDFADEWCTKVMFEQRFHTEELGKFGAAFQMRQKAVKMDSSARNAIIEAFVRRQRGRRDLVGSSNWSVMELTLRTVCECIEENLDEGIPFLFGTLPTQADFAMYGQLRQGLNDAISAKVMRQYPGAWGWVSSTSFIHKILTKVYHNGI